MKKYVEFPELFKDICNIKQYVIKLRGKDLQKYRNEFYLLSFPEWRLNLLWEYIWNDISYEQIKAIFENSKII